MLCLLSKATSHYVPTFLGSTVDIVLETQEMNDTLELNGVISRLSDFPYAKYSDKIVIRVPELPISGKFGSIELTGLPVTNTYKLGGSTLVSYVGKGEVIVGTVGYVESPVLTPAVLSPIKVPGISQFDINASELLLLLPKLRGANLFMKLQHFFSTALAPVRVECQELLYTGLTDSEKLEMLYSLAVFCQVTYVPEIRGKAEELRTFELMGRLTGFAPIKVSVASGITSVWLWSKSGRSLLVLGKSSKPLSVIVGTSRYKVERESLPVLLAID